MLINRHNEEGSLNKAFALIELLAVIVILAIVALIAVPVIINIIERARKGAFEDSAYGVIDAAKLYYADKSLDEGVTEEIFTFPGDTKLKIAGEKPKSGKVILKENGKVSLVMHNDIWCALKNNDEEKIRIIDYNKDTCKVGNTPTYEVYQNGTAVYYNPVTNTKCTQSEAVSTTGTKSGCMKWYTFLDTEESENVNIILDHNTTAASVAYNASGSNAEDQLKADTADWQSTSVRLITADEVAEITGAKTALQWKSDKEYVYRIADIQVGSNISGFYFDGSEGEDPKWQTPIKNSDNKSNYAWLYNNTYDCLKTGCEVEDNNKYPYIGHSGSDGLYGYWTSSAVNTDSSSPWYNSNWYIGKSGFIGPKVRTDPATSGVRPVITIPKQILS